MTNKVFVCHASEDAEIANLICNKLEENRIGCWIAPRDTEVGNFMGSLAKAIKNSTIFVLIYSDYANNSPHVMRELERAINLNIPIIPYRISDTELSETMEYAISSQHWIDGFPGDTEQYIPTLINKLKQKLNINEYEEVIKAIEYLGIHVTDEGLNILTIKDATEIKTDFVPLRINKNSTERELQTEIINVVEDTAFSIGKHDVMDVNEINSISIALPGPVTEDGGKIHFTSRVRGDSSPTMSMRTVLQKKLRYDGKVNLYNDANADARAEYYLRNIDPDEKFWTRSLIYIHWGGGIGGGIVINGNLITGNNGYAGEIGHAKISNLGPVCNCGSTGCLEAYLSEAALKKMVCQSYDKHEKLFNRYNNASHPYPSMPPLLNRKGSPKDADNIDIEKFLQEASRTDDPALNWQNDVIDNIANFYSLSLTNLLYHLDPEVIVFGGNLGRCVNQVILDYIKLEIQNRIFISEFKMEKTRYNQNATLIGSYPYIENLDENDQLRESIVKLVTQ